MEPIFEKIEEQRRRAEAFAARVASLCAALEPYSAEVDAGGLELLLRSFRRPDGGLLPREPEVHAGGGRPGEGWEIHLPQHAALRRARGPAQGPHPEDPRCSPGWSTPRMPP